NHLAVEEGPVAAPSARRALDGRRGRGLRTTPIGRSTGDTRRTAMIETQELTKMYGELYALNRLNLTLQQGDVYGFIGPNGAGKTTTMRILATLLNPSWGEATVCGYSIYTGSKEIRRVIGYMPDFFGVYDDMKLIDYLEFF